MSGGVNVLSSSAVFFQHAISYFKAKEDRLMRERTVPPRHYEFSFPHSLHGKTVDAIGCSKVVMLPLRWELEAFYWPECSNGDFENVLLRFMLIARPVPTKH
jgi:hypothetical protein